MTDDRQLPPNAQVFIDHLVLGLDQFGFEWEDFLPHTCISDKDGSVGLLFSQVHAPNHSPHYSAKHSIVVSRDGLEFPNQNIIPFTNEQSPTKLALLVLGAMVQQEPLDPQCPTCNSEVKT